MAERSQQYDPSSEGASSNLLSSAFSRHHAYQRMNHEGDFDMMEFNPANLPGPIDGPDAHGLLQMDPEMTVSPIARRSLQRDISPVTVHAYGQDHWSTPDIVVSPQLPSQTEPAHGEQLAPTPQKAPRQTKFTEMLRRSLTSPWERNMGSSTSQYEGSRDIGSDYSSRGIEASPMGSPGTPDPNYLHTVAEHDGQRSQYDPDNLSLKYTQAPLECHSRRDVHIRRRSWLYVVLIILSLYSTLLSGLWFVVSIVQPRFGRGISSSSAPHTLQPSTASLLTALFAKTTELSFVTVFVAFTGQVLTRRAFIKQSKGVTLAEMTMRSWVLQPGSLFTHWEGIPYAAGTVVGVLTLLATMSAIFYTTASDAMVTPKLMFGNWEYQELRGLVRASYANPYFVKAACTTPINTTLDELNAGSSCLDVEYSGQSYRNLLAFMKTWQEDFGSNGTAAPGTIADRPVSTSLLFDNTTMYSSWIETEFSDPTKNPDRIINNVTLAMPHPGVYSAATDPINGILQPGDLSGVGEYQIRASVGSPAVNVLCANIAPSELAPLVYTTWPNAQNDKTDVPGQLIGNAAWMEDVPVISDDVWLNATEVDDVFHWGEKYGRRPPVFQMFPLDFNTITNTSVLGSDSIYLLAKTGAISNFTLCELRSWLSPKCSTQFNISGIAGAQMRSHCEDPNDTNAYWRSVPGIPAEPSVDWKNMADEWRLSMDLNGGISNNNASNARILTNMILGSPELPPLLPSMAEALAVLASSTLVIGSLQSTYRQYWDASYPSQSMDPGVYEQFNSTLKMQQYASVHTEDWQAIFYVVLGLVFIINLICLFYFVFRYGMVTDYTEPMNLFALAVNSPPSQQLQGSCGGGPRSRELVVPWRVGYAESANHYFFEEANEHPWRGKYSDPSAASGVELLADGSYRNSYKRLSASRTWL